MMVCKERPSTVPRSAVTSERTHHYLLHLNPPRDTENRAHSRGRAWSLTLQVSFPVTLLIRPTCVLLCRVRQFPEHCTRRPGTPGVKGLEAAAQKIPAPTNSSREIPGLSAGPCNVGSENQKCGCDKQPSWSPGPLLSSGNIR